MQLLIDNLIHRCKKHWLQHSSHQKPCNFNVTLCDPLLLHALTLAPSCTNNFTQPSCPFSLATVRAEDPSFLGKLTSAPSDISSCKICVHITELSSCQAHICACVKQTLDYCVMSFVGSVKQQRPAFVVTHVHLWTVFQQQTDLCLTHPCNKQPSRVLIQRSVVYWHPLHVLSITRLCRDVHHKQHWTTVYGRRHLYSQYLRRCLEVFWQFRWNLSHYSTIESWHSVILLSIDVSASTYQQPHQLRLSTEYCYTLRSIMLLIAACSTAVHCRGTVSNVNINIATAFMRETSIPRRSCVVDL